MNRLAAASLLVLTALVLPLAPHLERFPYLQSMTSRSVIVAWETREPIYGGVALAPRAGPESSETVQGEDRPLKRHAVTLSNLSPGTPYRYRLVVAVKSKSHPWSPVTPWYEFRTFPEGDGPLTFAALGDSGTGSPQQKRVAIQLARQEPNLVLHTGDVIYGGRSQQDFTKKFFLIYAPLLTHVPFFPTLGNHDQGFQRGDPYVEAFYLPERSGTERYYSFVAGQAYFASLDSNQPMNPGSPQYAWFESDIGKAAQPIKIVYFHHPPYSTGYHGSTMRIRRGLVPLLEKERVTLVLSGHDHDYERTIPIRGVTYVVTGGGGALLYPAATSEWTAASRAVYHFVVGKVSGARLHLEAIDEYGKRFDQADLQAASRDQAGKGTPFHGWKFSKP